MRRRRFDPDAQIAGLRNMAEKMAAHFGQPLQDFRYAKYEFHNGQQWTIHCCWQRLVEGAWVDEDWLPKVHSTH